MMPSMVLLLVVVDIGDCSAALWSVPLAQGVASEE